jgi:glycosyltransferase involved in cell wall biosynthesis
MQSELVPIIIPSNNCAQFVEETFVHNMISVVMPTYKRADLIGRSIESIISQTYTNWELIIVDDNPYDSENRKATVNVVEAYSDSRIKYVKNKCNIGGAQSRNMGIAIARGEYIAFLDDDDVYLPNKLQIQIQAMQLNDWDVCVMDGATYSAEDESLISIRHQRITSEMSIEELKRMHLMFHISGTNTFMYKSNFLKSIGGFEDVPSCHEYILMQKTLDFNPKFGYIPKILIRNYMHQGEQISTSEKKIKGQKIMYKNKKMYFHLLTYGERRKVTCRHYGVMFFVCFKMKKYFKALYYAIVCVCSSPISAWNWFCEYKNKVIF